MKNLFLGIDLGTSAVKVLVCDENAVAINEAKEEYDVSSPKPLFNEQHPDLWWEATIKAFNNASKTINKKDIKAISFSGQMHGLVALDKDYNVIRPCILWNDGRSFEEVKYLNNVIGEDVLIKETGNIAFHTTQNRFEIRLHYHSISATLLGFSTNSVLMTHPSLM